MSRISVPPLTTVQRRKKASRCLSLAGLVLVTAATFSSQVQAGCEYVITNQWNDGFTANIRITNTGTTPINGWNVSWQYSGDNRLTSYWNANYSGDNPYSASNLGWNGNIQPNQSVEVGFQGTKGSASAEVVQVTGDVCGESASSSSVSSSSSSAGNQAAWDLDGTASYLNFVTTKNTHNVELHHFTALSGSIGNDGVARVSIDLNTVKTGVNLRDQRVRDFLFETVYYPSATITVNVPATVLNTLAVGQTAQTNVSADVDLHGVTKTVSALVSVQRLSDSRILVQSMAPVLTRATDFNLTAGVEVLRNLVNLSSISAAVPVDFTFVFDAR
ncbi:cellulose binding domain-containing protein [Cellvibrio polysaccharolyticus]|uniref:Carbohydrate-binding protein n=1 Tax=Cellvibrio polysaccharolyticus TaxID=2082724 RepID=A0A928YT42_9GAMM|nr:cellulose binding domain-containing protein [Cellvibrio polysaccharolyticus]MBE8717146.1 carbohydrate-binding protein [Cellvibrio polysaccharolyticus]